MLIEAIPTRHNGMDCLEGSIASAAGWLRRGYELMFIHGWDFQFETGVIASNKLFSERLSPGNGLDAASLEQYHGIRLHHHRFTTSADVYNIVKNQLLNHLPIIISLKANRVPWDLDYQLDRNSQHYLLVVGLNESDRLLYCSDAYYDKFGVELSLDIFLDGCYECGTFEIVKNENRPTWQEVLPLLLGSPERSLVHSFASMRQFAAELVERMDIYKETTSPDGFWKSPLISFLEEVSRNRKKLAILIRSLQAREQDMDHVRALSEAFEMVGNQWGALIGLFYKASCTSDANSYLQLAASKIEDMANTEEQLALTLTGCIESGRYQDIVFYSHKSYPIQYDKGTDSISVSLDEHLNNKGFGYLSSDVGAADFTGFGRFFVAEGLSDPNMIVTDDVQFQLTGIQNGKYDNISCSKQYISVANGMYTGIAILGCGDQSTQGNPRDIITLCYENGKREQLVIGFTDWIHDYYQQGIYGEKIAWEGEAAEITQQNHRQIMAYQSRLYAHFFALVRDCNLVGILLPDCPRMHIFSITLTKNTMTKKEDYEEKVQWIVQELLRVDHEIMPEENLNLLGLHSTKMIQLVVQLEKEFAIAIDDRDISPRYFTSIRNIASYIRSYM